MATSVHADAPPEVVSDPEGLQYATGPQLGKGGFAICHRAELLGHGQMASNIVALKIVKSKMEPPKLAQKFVTELQIHSKLSHPNIVEFYRAFSFQSSTFVVLELCENGSLADAIKKRKYFTMPEIRRFMIQTCGAIKYLHQRSIVHRDLKTGNLFLDKDMNIKVGDFGLAALLVSPNDLSGIRRTTMCGTPNYLAPEVLEKSGKGHNEKVDLWAVGIMMYTLAVGRAPFHASKREQIYEKLRAREYTWPDISKFPNQITEDLRDVVGSLLVPEDDRPNPDQIVSHSFFKRGYIPLELSSTCTSVVPQWPRNRPPTPATVKRGYTEEWYTLCKASAVGEYELGKTFGAYGARRNKTVAKDCHKEIESGKQPTIPFAKDTVYLPFPERNKWPYQTPNNLSEISEEKDSSSEGQALLEITGNGRGKPQHHPEPDPDGFSARLQENVRPAPPRDAARQPVLVSRTRSIRKVSNERVTAATAAVQSRPTRLPPKTRSTKDITKETESIPEDFGAPRRTKTALKASTEQPAHPAADVPAISAEIHSKKTEPTPPLSDPSDVLIRLHTLRDNIARALQKKAADSSKVVTKDMPFVAKWVDYSRKYGVGYVLEDGTVGSIVRGSSRHPVTVVVARDGVECLREAAKDPANIERIPLEFYVDTKGSRLTAIDIKDKSRRGQVCGVWLKFGKYMCAQLAESEDKVFPTKPTAVPNIAKFYQRLGNVGIWEFMDGSFQFNFPDHTKLVLSADAGACNFTCLSLDALETLERTGKIPYKHMKTRTIVSGHPQKLLYGSASSSSVAKANDFKRKLQFILSVAEGWVRGGGIGHLPQATNFKWDGPQMEDPKKHDWVTIGRFGGDDNDSL